ncbi:MAG: hypothetical protein Phog2KO_17490 [Phototrophicaceae bacterium]
MTHTMLDHASKLLKNKFNTDIHLELLDTVYDYDDSPSTLIRCATQARNSSLPKTLIIKRFNKVNDSLLYELCALEFLADLSPNLAPHLYAYDTKQKLIILEDLGDADKHLLGNILFGNDSAYAENALIEFNKALAQLHLTTQGKEKQWQQLLGKQGNPSNVSRHRINHIQQAIIDLPERFQEIGISISENTQNDLNQALQCIANPQQFLSLVHGDSTPANAFYRTGKIKLLDFETSNFRHCLLDGSYSRLRYLHSVWAREIPVRVQRKSMTAYTDIFLAHTQLDKTLFDYHLGASCVAWLAGLFVLLPTTIEKDKKWGRSTNRQRLVTGLQHFIVIADEYSQFHALRDACLEAEQKLRRMWSEEDCTMRLYPAFVDSNA